MKSSAFAPEWLRSKESSQANLKDNNEQFPPLILPKSPNPFKSSTSRSVSPTNNPVLPSAQSSSPTVAPQISNAPTLAALITPIISVPPSTTSTLDEANKVLEKAKVIVPTCISSSIVNKNRQNASGLSASTSIINPNSGSLISKKPPSPGATMVGGPKSSLTRSTTSNPKFIRAFSEPSLPSPPPTKEEAMPPSRKLLTDPSRKPKTPKIDKLLSKNIFYETIQKTEDRAKKLQQEGLSKAEIEQQEKMLISDTANPVIVKDQDGSQQTTTNSSTKEEILISEPALSISLSSTSPPKQQSPEQLAANMLSMSPIPTSPTSSDGGSVSMVSSSSLDKSKEPSVVPLSLLNSTIEEEDEEEEQEEHEERFLRGLGWVPAEEDSLSDTEIEELSIKMKEIRTVDTNTTSTNNAQLGSPTSTSPTHHFISSSPITTNQ
eukprot:gene15411-18278_t